MRRLLLTLAALTVATGVSGGEPPAAPVHHQLTVRVDPTAGSFRAVDSLTVKGEPAGDPVFLLHAGLAPRVLTPGWRLEPLNEAETADFSGINATSETAGQVPLEGFRLVRGRDGSWPVDLAWGGVIRHPLRTSGEEYQRAFSETPGLIEERGVFLSGSSYWVPTFGDALTTFDLTVEGLIPPWDAVSQGARSRHELDAGRRTVSWTCSVPQEEIYLVAGPWHEYRDRAGTVELFAFLREDDPALARTYLDATRRYLAMYQSILPPYPYPSFALVENFWETGYGMPGFTLLGPRIIRFPWILTSSYPHELLHNWWGNSVYVNFSRGNWCEGLTAYMADHMLAEQRGEGVTYRRATLKKFTDFVRGGKDFPLSDFGNRSSAASEAVGYGKALMVFHMVRRALGDQTFLQALRAFYRTHRFRRASWDDLAAAFSAAGGGEFSHLVGEWTTRPGAPRLEIVEARVDRRPGETMPWGVHLVLRQAGVDRPFPMTVPVALMLEGCQEAMLVEVGSCEASCELEVPCPARPLRLDVDPEFDVMRRLDPLEVPPALSTLFGAQRPLFVLPAAAPAAELEAWRRLASDWARPTAPETVLDTEIEALPGDRSCWVLGWANRLGPEVARRVAEQGVALEGDHIRLPDHELSRAGHSLVLVARAEGNPAAAVGWVAADPGAAIPGLARKLPHYTRYSYLAFKGAAPDNVAKGMWRPLASPLVVNLGGGELPPLRLPSREPLAPLPPAFDPARLQATVRFLADPRLEGRGLGTPGLEEATRWVEARLREAGLTPAGDHGFRQTFTWDGGPGHHALELSNLVGLVPGTDPSLAPVLVTAHLDHLGRGWPDVRSGNEGKIHPGADDNASGVAVLLELARTLASEPHRARPVVFAVTTGEEAGLVGSRHLLANFPGGTQPFACLNIDTVGRLGEGKLYVLDADSAREWRFLWMGVGYTTGAPVTIVSEPLDASDQGACLERGIPAVQLFTGPTPDYHRPSDTADTIDPAGMATVAEAAHEALTYLADRREPLTVTVERAAAHATGEPRENGGAARRASLGTMPDFGYQGEGVRVARVMPGSPAERAGVQAGDVLVALDGAPIDGLRDLSETLKGHAPGDTVRITLRRDGRTQELTTTLAER